MNMLLALTARTLVEQCVAHPQTDIAAACDVALKFLRTHGASPVQLRMFLTAVRRELRGSCRLVSVMLTTPTGRAGVASQKITSSLESTLNMRVELEERADAGLLGGATLAVGDERLDRSLRGALQSLHHHLII